MSLFFGAYETHIKTCLLNINVGINILRGEDMDRSEYKKIIENMYDGVYYVDKNREILCWNKAAERITGFNAKDVIGSHCYNNVLNHQDNQFLYHHRS